jgi:hypothetical protein
MANGGTDDRLLSSVTEGLRPANFMKNRCLSTPFHKYARVSNRGARTLATHSCVQRSHSCERIFPGPGYAGLFMKWGTKVGHASACQPAGGRGFSTLSYLAMYLCAANGRGGLGASAPSGTSITIFPSIRKRRSGPNHELSPVPTRPQFKDAFSLLRDVFSLRSLYLCASASRNFPPLPPTRSQHFPVYFSPLFAPFQALKPQRPIQPQTRLLASNRGNYGNS